MKRAESLLPRTDALPCSTVAYQAYRDGWLVRHRDAQGMTRRLITQDAEQLMTLFWQWVDELKQEARRGALSKK